MVVKYSRCSWLALAVCVLFFLSALESAGAQAVGAKCPLTVAKLVDNAPDASIEAVKQACDPGKSVKFCESCICTVFANFVPATLRSAGVITNKTSAKTAGAAIGSCAPNSHVALLRLGALDEQWSQTLNSKCSDDMLSDDERVCDKFVPKVLPVKRTSAKEAGKKLPAVSNCPFQTEDIKPNELEPARGACVNTTDPGFCQTCLCAIQRSIDGIIRRREALLGSNTDSSDSYKGCYVVLTSALVEGEVLTPAATNILGSQQCRPFAALGPKGRKAACGNATAGDEESVEGLSPAAVAAAVTSGNVTAAPAPGAQKSASTAARPGGVLGSSGLLLATLGAAAWLLAELL